MPQTGNTFHKPVGLLSSSVHLTLLKIWRMDKYTGKACI